MSLYRRFARSKKGMSTIFGALFFVILILMGFNVMLWGFVQFDAYNSVITKMSLRDQQATSENLVPVNVTCNSTCPTGSGTLTIIVNNLGGSAVNIANVYIFNTNTTGACIAPNICVFAPSSLSANIPAGATNFQIRVSPTVPILGSNSYHITLASSRGRLYNLYYPWRFSSTTIINQGGNGGNFVTNVGPLAVYFDFKSFNYTQGTMSQSLPAFCMPAGNSLIYVRIANVSTNATVTILSPTMMEMQPYSANGFGQFVRAWVLSPTSINPSTESAYSYNTNPYSLAPSGPNGPTAASFRILKFGATSQDGTGSAALTNTDNWLTFIGVYYLYNGQPQGETIPFMDFQTSTTNCIS